MKTLQVQYIDKAFRPNARVLPIQSAHSDGSLVVRLRETEASSILFPVV